MKNYSDTELAVPFSTLFESITQAMKTVVCLLASVYMAFAQTNTNSFPSVISFTNTLGVYITNAEVVSTSPNKLIYRTDHGLGGGTIRLDKLPPDLQARFKYDPAAASAQDDIDKTELQKHLLAERAQAQIYEKYWNAVSAKKAMDQVRWDKAIALAKTNQAEIYGHVTAFGSNWRQVLAWSGTETIVVEDLSASSDVDCIAYHIGYCLKPSVNPLFETFRYERWTTDINKAAQYYLQFVPTNSVAGN